MPSDPTAERPRLRRDVSVHKVEGELLLFDPVRAALHHVDPVGSALLPFFDGTVHVDELAEDAAAVFRAPRQAVKEQLVHLVGRLGHAGLLDGAVPVPAPRRSSGLLADPPSP